MSDKPHIPDLNELPARAQEQFEMQQNAEAIIADLVGGDTWERDPRFWNFDMSALPRDRRFIAETTRGEILITSYNAPTKTTPKGWFSMIGDESRIVAWQELPAPSGRAVKS